MEDAKEHKNSKQGAGDVKSTGDSEKSAKASNAKNLRKIVDDSYDSSSSSSSKSGRQNTPKNDKASDKNLNLILDDWDSQQSEKFEDDEKASDGDKLGEDSNLAGFDTDDVAKATKKDEKSKSTESTAKVSETADKSGADEKQSAEKNELRTLINDWGDEDEDNL